jgi:Ca2+-binding EF-hand superfamily protein
MMRLLGLTLAVALAAATAAVSAPTASAPPKPPAAPRIFLSPSGEPFRQASEVPDPLKAWFDQVDAAHKGYIDRADLRADATRFFKKLDENSDGTIDGFEVADYESKVVPELAEVAEGRFPGQFGQGRQRGGGHREQDQGAAKAQAGQAAGGRGPQRPIQQLIDEPEPVSGADFALDSHITLAEWMRATDQRFVILDANKDGRVTLDELRARFLPIKR